MGRVHFARRLRKEGSEAERKLWQRLRARRLGPKFRRQQPIGPYVVEIDGGQHADERQRSKDEARTRWLEDQGFQVVR